MLSKLTRLGKLIIYTLIVTSLIGAYLIPKSNLVYATECPSSGSPELIIIDEPKEGEKVSGTQTIILSGEEGAFQVNVMIFYEPTGWREIYMGEPRSSYPWNTTIDPDGDHELFVWAQFEFFPFSKESKCHAVTVDNSASGTTTFGTTPTSYRG